MPALSTKQSSSELVGLFVAGAGLEPAPGAYETPELTRALPRGDILTLLQDL